MYLRCLIPELLQYPGRHAALIEFGFNQGPSEVLFVFINKPPGSSVLSKCLLNNFIDMINALPPDVLRLIIDHLLRLPPKEHDAEENDRSGYIGLRTWNQIYQPRNLLSLAHTCKYLRSCVLPVLFRSCACPEQKNGSAWVSTSCCVRSPCYEKEPGRSMFDMDIKSSGFKMAHSKSVDHFLEPFDSVMNNAGIPQFYLTVGFQNTDLDVLAQVKHLSLVFNGPHKIYYFWLESVLPKMVSLTDVTMNLYSPGQVCNDPVTTCPAFRNILDVVKLLSLHENTIRVHMFVELFLILPSSTLRYFEKLSHVLTQMSNLKVETLMIQPGNEKYRFPLSFCQTLGKLEHLKKLTVKPVNKHPYHLMQENFQGYSVSELVNWLGELPNLQHLDLKPCEKAHSSDTPIFERWELGASLRVLGMYQGQLSSCKRPDLLKHVTQLSLHFCNNGNKYPVLPNLKTLALYHYIHFSNAKGVLEHFSSSSRRLDNLLFFDCKETGVVGKSLLRILAKIKTVELHKSQNLFLQTLEGASHMHHFTCDTLDTILNTRIQFAMLLSLFAEGRVSKELQTIRFRPTEKVMSQIPWEEYQQTWLKLILPKHWPEKEKWDFVEKCVNEPESRILLINVPHLLEPARKYGALDYNSKFKN